MKVHPDNPEEVNLVFDYVDDFLFTGSNPELVYEDILEFRKKCKTTMPKRNAEDVLGLHITRLRKKRVILIDMRKSIAKLTNMLTTVCDVKFKSKNCPMLPSQFLVTEAQFGTLDEEISKFIEETGMLHLYMSILGSLNWIGGIRFDISLPVTYLAWNAKAPRQHHFQVALHCAQYLHRTYYLPLVLGGSPEIQLESFCDHCISWISPEWPVYLWIIYKASS